MLPTTLGQWTVDEVVHIVTQGMYETESFDLKESLPRSSDQQGKERLQTTCAAFANSDGGFLIFGVKDDRSLAPIDRLAGVDSHLDFPEHFGAHPARCTPSVGWDFLNPPIPLPSGRVLHIIEVRASPSAPHATGSPEESWRFPKRTNRGNESMPYSEVQLMFLGYYEKRIKLQLLRSELEQIKIDAASLDIVAAKDDQEYALATIDLSVLNGLLSDTYSLTYRDSTFLTELNAIRSRARIVNNKTAQFRASIVLPMSNKQDMVRAHNRYIRPHCHQIVSHVDTALPLLDSLMK
ncbi:MAG: ATP-binding protein [Acidimicrobiales bacterium]